jgi:hypothetical protein
MITTTIPILEESVESAGRMLFDPSENPQLCLYRDRTIALLRKYMRLALDTGRVPSVLGKEIFRSKVSSYRMITFEDAVVFVHDVENCLERLDEWSRTLISRSVMEEYTYDELAIMLNCSKRTIIRSFRDALDRLTQMFLWAGVLREKGSASEKSCQEGKNDEIVVSACKKGE